MAKRGRPRKWPKATTPRQPRKGKASRKAIKFRYIAAEQFNYDWLEQDVREFIVAYIDLRTLGTPDKDLILDLAKLFKRKPEEVAILIMDLGNKGYIGPRGKGTKPQKFSMADCD